MFFQIQWIKANAADFNVNVVAINFDNNLVKYQ